MGKVDSAITNCIEKNSIKCYDLVRKILFKEK